MNYKLCDWILKFCAVIPVTILVFWNVFICKVFGAPNITYLASLLISVTMYLLYTLVRILVSAIQNLDDYRE